jgi:hypothetical protein
MTYPFIYINHGEPIDIYSFQGSKETFFWFNKPLEQSAALEIIESCPGILKGDFRWSGNVFINTSFSDEDEIIGYYSKKLNTGYDLDDEKLTKIFREFARDTERWAVKVNEIIPVRVFRGVDRVSGSAWDKWSIKNLHTALAAVAGWFSVSAKTDKLLGESLSMLISRHKLPEITKKQMLNLIKIQKI